MNRPDPRDIPVPVVEARRRAVLERLGAGVMVLPAAPIRYGSHDAEYPYQPDRELYYVSGATDPGTIAVLSGGADPRFTLFVTERDPDVELWSGVRLGVDGAGDRFRPDACLPLSELGARLPELLAGGDRLHFRLGRGDAVERMVLDALRSARMRGARTGTGPRGVVDPGEILDELRLVKDEYELGMLRGAAELTVEGHAAAARTIAPGVGEWAVEAAADAAFRGGGAMGPAFETIVGSGVNACVLHYVANRDVIRQDHVVLVDAGSEYGLYNGDATRTYPSGGRFTGPQRDVYQVVEAARVAAVSATRPGETIGSVHSAATRVLVEGLLDLGILTGSPDEVIDGEKHKPFYPHNTSHWLGLDVHDPGDYVLGGEPRVLEPGMVFTVEPGLYFRPEHEGSAGLAGIGVRIEDDVLVTAQGCEILTSGLPTDLAEVEGLVGGSR